MRIYGQGSLVLLLPGLGEGTIPKIIDCYSHLGMYSPIGKSGL